MLTTRSVVSVLSVAMMVLSAGLASGQNFPNKPIRMLANEAGGSTFGSRISLNRLQPAWISG